MLRYAIVDSEAWIPQYQTTYSTVGEAAECLNAGYSIVAIEDGVIRALDAWEESEYQKTIGAPMPPTVITTFTD